MVEVLLESGASINIPDVSGRTPMDKALFDRFRYPRILARLFTHAIILYCCGFSVNLGHLSEVCRNETFSNFKKSCKRIFSWNIEPKNFVMNVEALLLTQQTCGVIHLFTLPV
ncbi:hypothetical protein WA026_019352 [Henosepilachna vigintioctopunctata]|uniref:Uncharacterized protein n=1 Tax=Henosepilachna vigintioctopunctata TaxID=420089 RepID=A0AAW1U9C5_9CUCU